MSDQNTEIISEAQAVQMMKAKCRDNPEGWIAMHADQTDMRYIYETDSMQVAGNAASISEVECALRISGYRVGLPKYVVDAAFSLWLTKERTRVVDDLRASLAYKPGKCEIGKWVKAVTGDEDALTVAVMTQWVWQVRRKMFGLPVHYHIMPVIYGAIHGGGKTTAVKMLTSPLSLVRDQLTDLSLLHDDRQAPRLSKSYVVVCDEMAGAVKADIESIKNRITSEVITYRELGTHRFPTVANHSSFIGTSNKPLDQLVQDHTGMRRFYQIDALAKLDWGVINSLDYLAIWQSVDEKQDAPIKPFLSQLATSQDEYRARDAVEVFVSKCVPITSDKLKDWTPALTLQKSYRDFVEAYGLQSKIADNVLGSRIKELAGSASRKRAEDGIRYRLAYNPASDPTYPHNS